MALMAFEEDGCDAAVTEGSSRRGRQVSWYSRFRWRCKGSGVAGRRCFDSGSFGHLTVGKNTNIFAREYCRAKV